MAVQKGENGLSSKLKTIGFALIFTMSACSDATTTKKIAVHTEDCPVELVVLGVGQDAGAPQIGNPDDPAWKDASKRLWATSLALIDHKNGKRYLFEATPDIREQIQYLDEHFPVENKTGLGIDGIFLTHAHIGHYAGLMFLGRESAGTSSVPVYSMPRMKEYLETNGPWSQLVELKNIQLDLKLTDDLAFKPLIVPHRDEFSETVGYVVQGKNKSAFFVPDIDDWEEWANTSDQSLLNTLQKVDYGFLDATFYDNNELPGRDMSQIPHPRVTETMDLIDATGDDSLKDKVRFIHINHTNPLRDKTSDAYQEMTRRGYKLTHRGERFCL